MRKVFFTTVSAILVGFASNAAHAMGLNAPYSKPGTIAPSAGYLCEDRNTLKHAWIYIDTKSKNLYWQVDGHPAYYAPFAGMPMVQDVPVINEFGNVVSSQPMVTSLWADERPSQRGPMRALKSFSISPTRDGHLRYTFGFFGDTEAFGPAFSAECLPNAEAVSIVDHATVIKVVKSKEQLAKDQATPTPKEYQTLIMQTIAKYLPQNAGKGLTWILVDADGTIVKTVDAYPNANLTKAIKAIGKFPAPPDGHPHHMDISINMSQETECALGHCSTPSSTLSTAPKLQQQEETLEQKVAKVPPPPPGFCKDLPRFASLMDPLVAKGAKMKCGIQ